MKSIALFSVCLFVNLQSYAQNKTNICELQLTLNELITTPIHKSCFNLSDDTELSVLSFKLKVPGFPTASLKGNQLTKQVIGYIAKRKTKGKIQVFDIKLKDETIVAPKSIVINLK